MKRHQKSPFPIPIYIHTISQLPSRSLIKLRFKGKRGSSRILQDKKRKFLHLIFETKEGGMRA